MENQPWQWNYEIKGLIPEQVKLKRKVWLKKGDLFLEKKGDKLHAFLLGNEENCFDKNEIIESYLRFSCLISNNAPVLEGRGGVVLKSKNDFGKRKKFFTTSVRLVLPDEAVKEIDDYAHKFIGFIRKLHDKYIAVVAENDFIEIALDYFYDAQKKFVYNNEGFISAVISMEALFNEGPADIRYKLSHRAAFLLGLCGMDPIETFNKLKDFYNKRSKLVHGGGTLPYEPDRCLVSTYTRRSLIIFLILLSNKKRKEISKNKKKAKPKDELLKEIDHAMLDPKMRNSLKKEINKGLKDFKLPIPRTFKGKGKHGDYSVTVW